ncbi:nuclear transport factor 2 family protein [Chryseobacterium fluminis]|uniref:nuclear transport factor 2 family protein n=1 Tax=Chryseobacterium fluminis TaxID=2983606 RepID=UPI00224CAD3A|nr:nuclear transport factor 2 family protein [Chryseobacterium sp. MMS21-Ot14]UZT99456.1 nuclear transport factor 2 family protein [Chryseobacterium sp. MMS21-Ot14]
MNKLIMAGLFFSGLCSAQLSSKEEVQKPVEDLFLGMKNADSKLVSTVFTDTAIIQTVAKDGSVKTESVKDFIASISKAEKNELDEKITVGSINIDGNLASIFTPYQFYLKDKFTHCGANSFQLVKQNNTWKIQYLIDTRRKENCEN